MTMKVTRKACHTKKHVLAKSGTQDAFLIRDENTEWLFDLHLDRFAPDDDSCADF